MDHSIRKVAVIGTGVLGTQIAALTAYFDYEVFAYDTNEQSFKKGIENIRNLSRAAKRKPTVTIEDWERGIDRLQYCDQLEEALADADLVIEAVPENLELKVGATVMCTKNSSEKRFINGTLGTIKRFDET